MVKEKYQSCVHGIEGVSTLLRSVLLFLLDNGYHRPSRGGQPFNKYGDSGSFVQQATLLTPRTICNRVLVSNILIVASILRKLLASLEWPRESWRLMFPSKSRPFSLFTCTA